MLKRTLFGILFLLVGCAIPPQREVIQLSVLHPLPKQADTTVLPLRVSVAAVVSPKGTAESYQPLLDYLSTRLARTVELVQRRTYAETNDLVEAGFVDVAFVCTSAYLDGAAKFGMELLAAPQVNGETVYRSLLLVPAESDAQSMADLRGKRFAFTDPISNTGRVYPTYLVQQLGSTPEQFFSKVFYTYNHDDAIRAVAEHLADGAAVDSLVYEFALVRDPSLAQRVRVIHRSPPFGIPPIVISPDARPQLKATLQELLYAMVNDPEGREALSALGVERFVPISDDAYDSARYLFREMRFLAP
ncbi:MAG: phosphate/phosphite/phosphonate ABC transporter substrate-binding protein [Chloroflexi bacterium CFX4]|nr:phosphate/phosphite/phosphonate ABC transporter substrate-binding protein [Chloroflexi bacterium CFX4]MDL1923943.1 phosphate/phosphite/phosphonate ABC transporter substrate-binding protein [Chloroflexi bacterium CFX3]